VVGGRFYSTETLVETLSEVTGAPVRPNRSLLRSLQRVIRGWKPMILNSEQAVTELGVAFRPLEETLRDTVEWFRQGPRPSSLVAAA
jgi:nucleoside-diphosphate-sugar epimerase